ncbi:MAG: radical SAM protein [Promethearchaeota archaeon]|jgi:cyclic pyranopterin phosphate synthase
MTTNGLLLFEKAEKLYKAGLNRINVSLASLNSKVYKKIYGSDTLEQVLKGLQKAKEVGFNPIKLNFVLMKGLNDNELEDMINYCAKNDFILQIIELHKVSEAIGGNLDSLELRSKQRVQIRGSMQNRKIITLPNGAVIETITPSHEFCLGCTKLRVGCDGNLFGCLYRSDLGKNIKEALQNHHSLSKYEQIVKQVLDSREPYY